MNLDKEFGHYPKSNGKSLKTFKLGRGMMSIVLLKDRLDCGMENGLREMKGKQE